MNLIKKYQDSVSNLTHSSVDASAYGILTTINEKRLLKVEPRSTARYFNEGCRHIRGSLVF